MIVAIRKNELYANYYEQFTDVEITCPFYGYQLVEVPYADVDYEDFEEKKGKFIFNESHYWTRIENKRVRQYSLLVNKMIRDKYDISQELAILRQKEEKVQEYQEYFTYCERAKEKAKIQILDKQDLCQ